MNPLPSSIRLAGALLLAICLTRPAAAQTLTSNGATLTVTPGATLFVRGGLLQNPGGTLTNDGTIQMTGDFVSTATAASLQGTGRLRFSGATDQSLVAPAGATLANLEVANTGPIGNNRVLVPNDLTVTGQLLLTTGLARTAPTATITLPNGAVLTGEALHRYVQGNLRVERNGVPGVADFGHGLILDGTGQSLGAVAITRSAGLTTPDLTYGTNSGANVKCIDRIWTLAPTTQPVTPVAVTVRWLTDDDNGLTDFSQARGWQQTAVGTPWVPVGAPTDATNRSLTQSLTVLNRLTVSSANSVLAVELTDFTARRAGPDGVLRWTTASEQNNAGFVVESATDGRTFRSLGWVPGHGTSGQPHTYEWTDARLTRYAAPVVYYRLRQLDDDRTETLSLIRSVAVAAGAAPAGSLSINAFPNPLSPGALLTLRLSGADAAPATLLVTDVLGRTLVSEKLKPDAGTTLISLPQAARWPAGTYLLRVRQGASQQVVKVVRE